VRRYLNELSLMVELESIATTPGGANLWRIKPSERGRAVLLRRTQAYGLLLGRRMLEGLRGSAFVEELDLAQTQILLVAQRPVRAPSRNESTIDARLEERFFYAPAELRNYTTRVEDFDALLHATAELRPIRYVLAERQPSAAHTRAQPFLPFAVIVHRGTVYVVGENPASTERSVLMLDRMGHVELDTTERFDVPPDFDATLYLHGEFGVIAPADEPVDVLIEFDASAAAFLRNRRVHPTQKVAIASDGRMRLSVRVPNLDCIRPWLLSFGPRAKVVVPAELAAQITDQLRQAIALYSEA
jgi:predicted DNA-binding transcriptional regulator YafY